jgi:hypothetical protein
LVRRARIPRSYSLSAVAVAVGCRTGSALGLLGSAKLRDGVNIEVASAKPRRKPFASMPLA